LNLTNSEHSSPISNFEPFQEFDIDTGHCPKSIRRIMITNDYKIPQNNEFKFTNLKTA